jgi:hypothetical protein
MASSRKKAAAKPAPGTKLQRYGDQALERLAWLMQHAESEQAQVAAAKELLERAGGGAVGAPEPQGLEAVVDRLRQLRAKT